MRKSHPADQTAHRILSVLRDQNAPVGVRVSMNSVGAELRGMLGEAEFLAGLEYARRQGWLDIEGSDIRITETGFQAAAK